MKHKLLGAGDQESPTAIEKKLKELTAQVEKLVGLSNTQAQRLQELENEKLELKSGSNGTGANSPLSSKVKCTNGKMIRPEDESRQVSQFLGIKTMKPLLKNKEQ